ncbi:MAG: Gfa-like protein [uncultured Sphingomonadaceae bacterium]|uniref:Gfa-like protein n=1 Tax=uncultured Sphingomonadaceae bacterium TaxID=169976 RepID=A0A6J4T8B1_9SPHN|nr:MAG: Gfa-like protein [uncultured Sphingomonadaceae bacterium]
MTETMTGGCQCGRVRYVASLADDEAYLCHCRMCQRAVGNVAAALKTLPKAHVRWERAPDYYASSPIARRGFCSACGTPLTFDYPDSPRMDLTVGSFDDPARFRPTHHFGAESRLRAWDDTRGLPETRSDEYAPLNARWEAAGGRPD